MLTHEQLQHFEEHGFVVVEDVLDRETVLEPLIAEYEAIMDDLHRDWIADGKLDPSKTADGFNDRIIQAYRNGLEYFQPMDISLPPGEFGPNEPFHAGPAAFNMLTDSRLLDVVEAMIGPEITSNPIQHVRIKPPSDMLEGDEIRAHITATDWHQDRAVTLAEADETRMVTAWIAITDATVENGCLQVIPDSHRGEMMPHCPNPQVGIPHKLIESRDACPVPVGAGGVVFFHPLVIHGSLANHTQGIRWSFDLRYNVTGDPTGRPIFPDFVARSRSAPETELRDPEEWHRMWTETRARLASGPAVTIHRWAPDAAHCA